MERKAGILLACLLPLARVLSAADSTPWDAMTGIQAGGAIAVTTKAGNTLKHTGGVSFSASAVSFVGTRVSISRQDVKEVVIRRLRKDCRGSLALGLWPLFAMIGGIEAHSIDKGAIPGIIIASPVILGAAAITGPPVLLIEGIRRLKPSQTVYRVIP